ncbi:hypothetical protein [Rhabdochromatium marinum]|uniref:hypothetical protein n=1 Tax=Rhabdochromatium marinum TaxID=48729 RepID=UPI00190358CD|nr:hypothetical protein [Rhabdochromatium marinum]MBK1649377.1 hypothetical protein [Rhabdochromatium marinum]
MKSNTCGWIGLAVALTLVVLLGGCVKVEQTLTLAKDGSGTLDIRYGMSEQTLAQLAAMQQIAERMGQTATEGAGAAPPFDFDAATVRQQFETHHPEGIALISLESETLDGWKYMNLKLSFEDLAALQQTQLFSDGQMSLSRNAAGNYVLRLSIGTGEAIPSSPVTADDPTQAAIMQQMAGLFAGMRIVTTVVAPSAVIASNATKLEDRTATWVFDVDEDPTLVAQLQQMELRLVFDSQGVELTEFASPLEEESRP